MFPAWTDFQDDPVIADSPTVSRVYARLLKRPNIFAEPQDVKAEGLAFEMRIGKKAVLAALALLVERGYATEHGRGWKNVRRLTLTYSRVSKDT